MNKEDVEKSRPSHEGRGLKFLTRRVDIQAAESPLTRGAWIEIYSESIENIVNQVAPHTRGVD